MKKIILVLLIIASKSTYSQSTYDSGNVSKKINFYGEIFQNEKPKDGFNYPQAIVNTTFTYDSTRCITEINDTMNADAYPWISPDGLRLYYIHGTNGLVDSNQLMFTHRVNTNSLFSTPTIVPIGIFNPISCWFSQDELDIYICANDTLFYSHRISTISTFNTPIKINLTGYTIPNFMSGASFNNAQNKLFIYFSDPSSGIAEFSRTSSTSFAFVRKLTLPVGYNAEVGQLSKDELTLYLGAEFNNISKIYSMQRSNATDSFNINTFQQIQSINDLNVFNSQPTMSDSLNWVVFVRARFYDWHFDELYISHESITSSVFNDFKENSSIAIFPNPSTGQFSINVPFEFAEIRITDLFGKKILETQVMQKTTILQINDNGVYLVYVTTKQGVIARKLIINR